MSPSLMRTEMKKIQMEQMCEGSWKSLWSWRQDWGKQGDSIPLPLGLIGVVARWYEGQMFKPVLNKLPITP